MAHTAGLTRDRVPIPKASPRNCPVALPSPQRGRTMRMVSHPWRTVGHVADKSAIEWTEATWNPTTGCDRVSPGCEHCYALTLSRRLKAMGSPKYQRDGDPSTSGPGFGLTIHPSSLNVPRDWNAPRLIFVNSMSDLFHDGVPLDFIQQVFDVIADTPQHTYQILTKRAQRLSRVAHQLVWPSNLWMGVSVESKRYNFRIDHLRNVPAAVRFVSAEPLLGSLGSVNLDGIHWVIAGGESGPHARPLEYEWVAHLRDVCTAAKVAFFFKQWGGRTPKSGGRELDGEFWDQLPLAAAS